MYVEPDGDETSVGPGPVGTTPPTHPPPKYPPTETVVGTINEPDTVNLLNETE